MKVKARIFLSTLFLMMTSSVLHASPVAHDKVAITPSSEKNSMQMAKTPVPSQQNEKDIWKKLVWSQKSGDLVVTNTSNKVVHLQPEINLIPDNMPVTLGKTDIQPGEHFVIHGVCKHHLPLQTHVVISLASSENGKIEKLTVPILK